MFISRIGSSPIDDFLAGAGGSSAGGTRLETIGTGIGLAGTVLALGVVAMLALVHSGPRSEVRALLQLAMVGGAVMLVGGAVEIAGTAAVLDVGWIDALTDGSAASGLLRLLGGLLVLLGLGDETVPAEASDLAVPGAEGPAALRWIPGGSSAFGMVGVVLGALSFSFDGHTVSQGPRLAHAATNVVHVVAAGVWVGGIAGLVVVGSMRRRTGSIGALLVRFSRLATVALVVVFLAGIAMGTMIIDGIGDITGTEWGRRLLVKTGAVGVAALLGAYHHLVVVPRHAAGDAAGEHSLRRTVALEAFVLAFVVVMSAILTRSSIA